jgi:hypothetical protein
MTTSIPAHHSISGTRVTSAAVLAVAMPAMAPFARLVGWV